MLNRVYVHLGLPKTATTSLQSDFFPNVNHDRYQYIGVLQPRVRNVSGTLFFQIISAVRSGDGILEARRALKQWLTIEHRSLIISEEMLTVGSATMTWQEQLSNLGKILYGLDHKILVTVREPISAMYSFYLEQYDRFQGKKFKFSDLALSDNEFRIYHYDELLNELDKNFESESIYIQKFENLVKKDFTNVEYFLDHPEMEETQALLNNHNQKKKNDSAVMVPKRFKLVWVSQIYQKLGGDSNSLALLIKMITKKPIQKIRSINYRSTPVPVLSDYERRYLKQSMRGTMDTMTERFGVSY